MLYCSNKKNLIKILKKDLQKVKSPKGFLYASNSKFKAVFGRDSLISSWQMLGIDSSIAKNTIKIICGAFIFYLLV